jgi:hypothetical protein
MIQNERDVQNLSRLGISQRGGKRWRNTIGAFRTLDGRFIRAGLANESARMNSLIKSGDWVGWDEVTITPEMVGKKIAIFVSDEYKKPNWKYSGTEHEKAQVRWANMVNRSGGDAKFITYRESEGLVNWYPDKEVMV